VEGSGLFCGLFMMGGGGGLNSNCHKGRGEKPGAVFGGGVFGVEKGR